jgi:predicted nucleic acid-binding protein
LKILVDVNLCLDVLLERKPFAEPAARLWEAVERKEVEGLLPAHGVTTIHHLVSREKTSRTARRLVSDLLRVFGVAPVDDAVLNRALDLTFGDFEDAVCAAAAQAAGCAFLVTRNVKDYKASPVPAVDPVTVLGLLSEGGGGPFRVSERSRPRGPRRGQKRARRN